MRVEKPELTNAQKQNRVRQRISQASMENVIPPSGQENPLS